jgi:hypothetical protein
MYNKCCAYKHVHNHYYYYLKNVDVLDALFEKLYIVDNTIILQLALRRSAAVLYCNSTCVFPCAQIMLFNFFTHNALVL